ncbi:MAG: hypothetical protein QM579_13860 [Desulfovibrio sp.]
MSGLRKKIVACGVNTYAQCFIHKEQFAIKLQLLCPVHEIRSRSNRVFADRARIYFQKVEGKLYFFCPETTADLKKLLHIRDFIIRFKNYVFNINLFWCDCCGEVFFYGCHYVIPPVTALYPGIGGGITGIKADIDSAASAGKQLVNPGRMPKGIGMHVLEVAVIPQPAARCFKILQQGGFSSAPAYNAVFFKRSLVMKALDCGKNGKWARMLPWFPQVAIHAAAVADMSVVIQGKHGKTQFWHANRMRKWHQIRAASAYLRVLPLDFLCGGGNVARVRFHIHRTACKRKTRYRYAMRVTAGLKGPFFKNKFSNELGAEQHGASLLNLQFGTPDK